MTLINHQVQLIPPLNDLLASLLRLLLLLLVCLSIRPAADSPALISHAGGRGAWEAALSSGLHQNGHLFLNTDRRAEVHPHPGPGPAGCSAVFTLVRPGLVQGKGDSGLGEVSVSQERREEQRGEGPRGCVLVGQWRQWAQSGAGRRGNDRFTHCSQTALGPASFSREALIQ